MDRTANEMVESEVHARFVEAEIGGAQDRGCRGGLGGPDSNLRIARIVAVPTAPKRRRI